MQGYGTVSECVDSCTPFVYGESFKRTVIVRNVYSGCDAVSRPLFIEEHGLRLLLGREGIGIELSRQAYEAGDWAATVEEAWIRGRVGKMRKRAQGVTGTRKAEGLAMAEQVVSWTRNWWADYDKNCIG